ncbi:MAG TPA: hypothetical protein VFI78_07085 [Salinimicrobium sp.]|nr:hypothetical protein [Salinimicrobium sp.]
MKKSLLFLSLSLLFLGCSKDDNGRNNNPYLVDLNFAFRVNLNLPQYNQLNYPGNSMSLYTHGIKGIVIYNLNNTQYLAFELTDPNHPPSDCSRLEVNGTEATCGCDDGNMYTIITGQQIEGEGQYSLKPYRIVRVGDVLEISN